MPLSERSKSQYISNWSEKLIQFFENDKLFYDDSALKNNKLPTVKNVQLCAKEYGELEKLVWLTGKIRGNNYSREKKLATLFFSRMKVIIGGC